MSPTWRTMSPMIQRLREMLIPAPLVAACGPSPPMAWSTCPTPFPAHTVSRKYWDWALKGSICDFYKQIWSQSTDIEKFELMETEKATSLHFSQQFLMLLWCLHTLCQAFVYSINFKSCHWSAAFLASREVAIIERGLQSFHEVSCIRFVKHSSQRDYLKIQSLNG